MQNSDRHCFDVGISPTEAVCLLTILNDWPETWNYERKKNVFIEFCYPKLSFFIRQTYSMKGCLDTLGLHLKPLRKKNIILKHST